ncbi:MAG: TIR domain-containing protein [Anaerolineae bacterium]
MPRIFISYSRVDRALTADLAARLRRINGTENVWYDEALHGGDVWWRSILDQIARCDIFMYLLSRDSLESPYCLAELNEARRLRKPVLPVLVRDRTPIPPDLSVIQYVDMSSGVTLDTITDLEAAINTLAASGQELPNAPLRPVPEPVPSAPLSSSVESRPAAKSSPAGGVARPASPPRRSRLPALAFFLLLVSVAVVVVTTFRPSVPAARSTTTKEIVIPALPATTGWFESGIEVHKGQSFTISARGEINIWDGCETLKIERDLAWVNCAEMMVGPEGGVFTNQDGTPIAHPADANWQGYPDADAPLYVLLGRIGNGDLFIVGAGGSFVARNNGTLQFRINDASEPDNAGEFVAIVTLYDAAD